MRSYCRSEEVLRKLRATVEKQLKDGLYLLPGEPVLAEALGASRMTVRNALKVLEDEGVIESSSRRRMIRKPVASETKGRILFVSGGVDWIVLPAWNRLWVHLEALARASGYACELSLWTEQDKFDASKFEEASFIVYSGVGGAWNEEFKRFAQGRFNIIGVEESNIDFLPHVVCLDNKAAGRIAAKLLTDAGYRKPALLRQENSYRGFRRREEGFVEGMAKTLPKWEVPCFHMKGALTHLYMKDCLEKIETLCSLDIDSLFLASDELMNLFYPPFAMKYRIPEEFGIVTLSASHESLIHQPPVTAVSHGSSRTAKAIMNLIERIRTGKQKAAAGLVQVEPGVHLGMTVRAAR